MEIDKILMDLRNEPAWRAEAAQHMDYYDNNQLSGERRQELEDRGMEPVVRNVIAPAINALLGMEERNRQDWRVLANDEPDTDEAVALSRKLHEVERMSGADRACSDAFATQAKIGIGWVEIRDADDPFAYPVVAQSVRWQEMWWDWRARQPLLDDARYLVRRKWFDADELEARFPGQAKVIRNAIDGWPSWYSGLWEQGSLDLGTAYGQEMALGLDEMEWRNAERKRMALFEVWYRKVDAGTILRVPEMDMVVEFDRKNPYHGMLVESGMGTLEKAPIRKVRRAYWVGPHQLSDDPSPYDNGQFPYVPFFAFREDRTGVPYGLIRLQKSPQDEANRRLSKMDWLLNAKTLLADSDAFENMKWSEVIAEAGRPDAALPLNPTRQNRNQKPEIHDHGDMSAQQFAVLQDALKWVSEVGGIYQAMLGKSQEQQSGVAINSLVEQGSTTQGELFGNFRLSRNRVGELLLAQTKKMLEGREVAITIARGPEKRVVTFNQRVDGGVSNALVALKTRVELSEVPSTPTFRAQMLNQLNELAKTLPAELQAVLIPSIVRGSDLPNKDDVAQLLEQAMGQGGAQEADPAQVLNQQRAAALEQRSQQLALDAADAKVQGERVKTEKVQAEIDDLRLQMQALMQRMQQANEDRQIQQAMVGGQIPVQSPMA